MSLSHDHLNRRVNDALNSASEESVSGNGVTTGIAFQSQETVREYSFLERLKSKINEKVLPRMNLTSYNNLTRTRDQINATNQRYHELWQRYHEMQAAYQSITSAKDELASELRSITSELQMLTSKRDQLALELKERQITSSENAALVHQLIKENKRTAVENRQLMTMVQNLQSASIIHAPTFFEVPPLVVVQRVLQALHDPHTIHTVKNALLKYFANDNDPNLHLLLPQYEQSLVQQIPYWDIRIAAHVLSKILKPLTYLEIGTRRGWSLAQVMAETPSVKAYVFDAWHEDYADAPGSPEFIVDKMQLVIEGVPAIEFIDGNSHDTLPAYFAGEIESDTENRPEMFDLITVDGDHSLLGAWQDLYDVFPHVRVGGAILFDDLEYNGEPPLDATQYERPPLPENLTSLRDVWHKMQSLYPNFVFIDCTRLRFQAGIAIRIS